MVLLRFDCRTEFFRLVMLYRVTNSKSFDMEIEKMKPPKNSLITFTKKATLNFLRV